MTKTVTLLHDPGNGPVPGMLSWRYEPREVAFHTLPDMARCDRCGSPLNVHVWQVVDSELTEQGGIADCGRKS